MKKYLIIALSFIIAYLISQYSVNNVFIPQSPRISPFYLANIQNDLNSTKSIIISLLNPFNKMKSSNSDIASIPVKMFIPLTKGVSAYHKSDKEVILDFKRGTPYKIKPIKLKDGTYLNVVDFRGK